MDDAEQRESPEHKGHIHRYRWDKQSRSEGDAARVVDKRLHPVCRCRTPEFDGYDDIGPAKSSVFRPFWPQMTTIHPLPVHHPIGMATPYRQEQVDVSHAHESNASGFVGRPRRCVPEDASPKMRPIPRKLTRSCAALSTCWRICGLCPWLCGCTTR